MKIKPIRKYVKDRLQSVEKNLHEYKATKNPENIHRLRVDIKKVRAILRFVRDLNGEKNSRKRIRPLFRSAGDVRNVQNSIHLLKAIRAGHSSLTASLLVTQTKLENKFLRCNKTYIKAVRSFRKKVHFDKRLPSDQKIARYLKKRIVLMDGLLHAGDRKSLHPFRFELKEIMYVYNVMPKKFKRTIHLRLKYIDKLQEALGEWHDAYIAMENLSGSSFSGAAPRLIADLKRNEAQIYRNLIKFCGRYRSVMR